MMILIMVINSNLNIEKIWKMTKPNVLQFIMKTEISWLYTLLEVNQPLVQSKLIAKHTVRWILSVLYLVHGPIDEIIPPVGIFVDPHIFVVWTLVLNNLVDGCKIDAGWRHNKLVSLATHAIFNEDRNALRCHILT